MDLALLVYGISLLHGLGAFFVIMLSLSAITIAGNWIYWIDGHGNERDAGCKARAWKAFWVGVIAFWFLILIPSEKTAYTMVGAYAAQKVAENDKVQQMSGKVLTIIEQKLDNYIEDGIKEAEDKAKKVNGKDKSR
jgi:hypothetical protein